jgi:hypothetical protein
MTKIKFTANYSTYRPGDIAECDSEVAQRLIAEGRAVPEKQIELIETASLDPSGESADLTPRRRSPRGM